MKLGENYHAIIKKWHSRDENRIAGTSKRFLISSIRTVYWLLLAILI